MKGVLDSQPATCYDVTVVTSPSARWVLLTYRVARDPSAGRVGVWRKLKRLGAILVHDSVWVLPATPRTTEQFQWLAAEIGELGGDAWLWHTTLSPSSQHEALIGQFVAQVDAIYGEILGALHGHEADLAALSKRYQQARALDYFNSPLGAEVRQALLSFGQEGRPCDG
jgi:Protein ChrB, N-terminal